MLNKERYAVPDWMRPYLSFFQNAISNQVEELLQTEKNDAFSNMLRYVMTEQQRAQFRLLEELHKKGLLNDMDNILQEQADVPPDDGHDNNKPGVVPKLTKEQAIILTGYTGIMHVDFASFHEAVEKRLGRPVWSHEFASKEVTNEIKEAYTQDFMALVEPLEDAEDDI